MIEDYLIQHQIYPIFEFENTNNIPKWINPEEGFVKYDEYTNYWNFNHMAKLHGYKCSEILDGWALLIKYKEQPANLFEIFYEGFHNTTDPSYDKVGGYGFDGKILLGEKLTSLGFELSQDDFGEVCITHIKYGILIIPEKYREELHSLSMGSV